MMPRLTREDREVQLFVVAENAVFRTYRQRKQPHRSICEELHSNHAPAEPESHFTQSTGTPKPAYAPGAKAKGEEDQQGTEREATRREP